MKYTYFSLLQQMACRGFCLGGCAIPLYDFDPSLDLKGVYYRHQEGNILLFGGWIHPYTGVC